MANQDKLHALTELLKEVLSDGQDIDSTEFPFVVIKGDIDGKGILWRGKNHNKQFLFASKPDRFYASETIDLSRGKSFSINNVTVLDETQLGATITKSNLCEVGHLKGLIVDGGLAVNQQLVYDPSSNRLGIGTDQPAAKLSIVDQNIELIFGAGQTNLGKIGTFNSTGLELVTNNTTRIVIQADGNIVLGNPSAGDVSVVVLGKLGVNVSKPDPRSALHVNGALKFNDKLHLSGMEPPSGGAFNEGDITWNTVPQPGRFVGWVCVRAGNPGVWNGFGRIE